MTTLKMIMPAYILALLLVASCPTKTVASPADSASKVTLSTQQQDTSLNGLYAGLEEMCWTGSSGKKDRYIDPARPKRKWYHLGYLTIKGDSAFLDQFPINVGTKKDTLGSASDGGFYYYNGTFQRSDTTILFNLKELFCDYCGLPVVFKPDGSREVIKRAKQLIGSRTDKGIVIDGYLYARTVKRRIDK